MPVAENPYEPSHIEEFNPADLANLVRYCVQELMGRPPYPLVLPAPFVGAGIYALFYNGDFEAYQHPLIKSVELKRPIYVGRARLTKSSGRRPLFNRLRDHAKSITAVENLNIEDFRCRFLVLHPLWVSTVEDLLIKHYATLWNNVLAGFGVHDPGKRRHTGVIPLWDVLHPGRSHEKMMTALGASGPSIEEVRMLVRDYCATAIVRDDEITPDEVRREALAIAEEDDDEGYE